MFFYNKHNVSVQNYSTGYKWLKLVVHNAFNLPLPGLPSEVEPEFVDDDFWPYGRHEFAVFVAVCV